MNEVKLLPAIVHDWLVNYMGSEKCIESFTNIWPDSDVYTLVDYLDDDLREIILKGKKANTSFIQGMPFSKKAFRNYLSLFPLAIEQFDLSNHDVILSSSHSVAKGVLTTANQLHVCYCHTPVRYAWDQYHQYLNESRLNKGIRAAIAKMILHRIRMWDFTTANRVDNFVANSNHIAKRIKKVYNKEADVIYPPVDTDAFRKVEDKEDYYLAVARFVPYKKIDLIVEAFSQMPDKKLLVIGSGPDEKRIKALAGKNVELLGYQPFGKLIEYMQKARAFVFAAEEDFGITIVEAQSCGTPVIAYGVGGATETVIENKTGMFFKKQTPESLIETVKEFDKNLDKFKPDVISEHTKSFSRKRFEEEIKQYLEQKYSEKFG